MLVDVTIQETITSGQQFQGEAFDYNVFIASEGEQVSL